MRPTNVASWCCAILMMAISAKPGFAEAAPRWIEARGYAYLVSAADRDAARRRAIGEALVSAALAGGASLRGHTVTNKGRITSDLAILRPTGRVLAHRVLSAELVDGRWNVHVVAQVGPMASDNCSGRRRLTISATPPEVRVAPEVAAWAEPLAQGLAHDLIATLRDHPDTDLVRLAPETTRPVASGLDYLALTQGRAPIGDGDHRLRPSINVEASGQMFRLVLTLRLLGPDGQMVERSFKRETVRPSSGVIGLLSGQSRRHAEKALTKGMMAELRAMLDGLACKPAQARILHQAGGLRVPLGRQHGLTRASLAFVDDPNDGFGLLEVVELSERHVALRPLDPSRSVKAFDGLRVYFLEAGL